MSKNLIVVESPAKARTITKYLGKDFRALASYGHVRDLIPKEGAVETDNAFKMNYQVIERNEKRVEAIARALEKVDALYLATDPDREGEAISWHLYEILNERGLLENKVVHRVDFNEFTNRAIQRAVDNPRKLLPNLIHAQQARRALDYLVGFNLSPLLWRKISPGLSAGRVQSPALRLIAEREVEIEKFIAREYWTVESDLNTEKQDFIAKLTHYDGEKLQQFSITNDKQAAEIESSILSNANGKLDVTKVEKKQRRRNPTAPFTTSTMQQEASRKAGFGAQRTMRTAQQLYEGIAIDGTNIGLITYMRTDSVVLSNDAVTEIRAFIGRRFGEDKVPDTPHVYKSKSKNAQEAHEAIRVTDPTREPDQIKDLLSDDQFKLYQLIWQRTVSCQMTHATLNTVAVDLQSGEGQMFRANGSTIVDPGFMMVYQEGVDDQKKSSQSDSKLLPKMKQGDKITLKTLRPEQHFTEPPPRYSEATLVKNLEAHGIGRPSTYASIIATLLHREYVELENRRFMLTDVGRVVNNFLSNHFARYVDYDFTANLEDQLDSVSRGEIDWIPVMDEFWTTFKQNIEDKAELPREEAAQSRVLGTDQKSGKPISVRVGRYGAFAQIGTREDEDKPKFAGLRPGQKMNTITLEEALFLFQLPRELGISPDGEKISANIGRFGPYIRYDDKFASLKEDDPYTVSFERALEVVAERKEFEANRIVHTFEDAGLQVLRGHYGPYVTDGNKNARIPKDREPETLTLEECQELIAAAPERRKKKKKVSKKKETKKVTKKKKTKKKAKTKARKKTKKKTTSTVSKTSSD